MVFNASLVEGDVNNASITFNAFGPRVSCLVITILSSRFVVTWGFKPVFLRISLDISVWASPSMKTDSSPSSRPEYALTSPDLNPVIILVLLIFVGY